MHHFPRDYPLGLWSVVNLTGQRFPSLFPTPFRYCFLSWLSRAEWPPIRWSFCVRINYSWLRGEKCLALHWGTSGMLFNVGLFLTKFKHSNICRCIRYSVILFVNVTESGVFIFNVAIFYPIIINQFVDRFIKDSFADRRVKWKTVSLVGRSIRGKFHERPKFLNENSITQSS